MRNTSYPLYEFPSLEELTDSLDVDFVCIDAEFFS